jgi:hypothetical protein
MSNNRFVVVVKRAITGSPDVLPAAHCEVEEASV